MSCEFIPFLGGGIAIALFFSAIYIFLPRAIHEWHKWKKMKKRMYFSNAVMMVSFVFAILSADFLMFLKVVFSFLRIAYE